jgi:hypothetical protein
VADRPVRAPRSSRRKARALEGEDLSTNRWEDARHWMGIYADLLDFKRGVLTRMARDLTGLHPVAQRAASVDFQIIETQMSGYQERLDLWFARIWELQGLRLDPEGRIIRYHGRERVLSKREYQFLQFLLDHPHRYFTAAQILDRAWADPALFPEEVRNYVGRLRKVLLELQVPVDLVNKAGRGYSLVFRTDGPSAVG